MENKPFEDVFPIENGDIPASYVSLPEGNIQVCSYMRGQHHAIQQAISTNLRGKHTVDGRTPAPVNR